MSRLGCYHAGKGEEGGSGWAGRERKEVQGSSPTSMF